VLFVVGFFGVPGDRTPPRFHQKMVLTGRRELLSFAPSGIVPSQLRDLFLLFEKERQIMRASLWLGAFALALALAAPAGAQIIRPTTSSGSFSNSPRLPAQNQFQVIDTTSANAPIAAPMAAPANNFSLLNYLPFTRRQSNQRNLGQSIFPTQSEMPGMQYLSAFGYQRPQRAQ
jgi:hypothetical protein